MARSEIHIANHLRLAAEDLRAYETLTASGNRFAVYHLEQAAEKLLLCLLTAENRHVERARSHRLDFLRDELPDENPFKRRFDGLTFLLTYATTYRYPKDGGQLPDEPSKDDLAPAAGRIGRMIDDAASHFGVDLAMSSKDPAARAAPPRTPPSDVQ